MHRSIRGKSALATLLVSCVLLLASCQEGVNANASQGATASQTTVTVTQTGTSATTAAPQTTTPPTTTLIQTTMWPLQLTGTFEVNPKHATIGSIVTASGTGYAPGATFSLMWQDVTGSWDVRGGEYYGRLFKESWLTLATIKTDAQGSFSVPFTVPDGFGFTHDLDVLDNGVILNKMGYFVDMQASLVSTSGPLGSPIGIQIKGMGWRDYENGWHVEYDNQDVGVITTVTTHGSGIAYIPATGAVGKHVIRVIEGGFTVSYLNHEECPFPDTPTFNLEYQLTPGDSVLPPALNTQSLPVQKGVAPAPTGQPQVWADIISAPVGTPMTIYGRALPANASVDLFWYGVSGNRVSGKGWEQIQKPIGSVKTDATGAFSLLTAIPDTHGGDHKLEAQVNGQAVASFTFTITPSIIGEDPASGPVGTIAHLHFKGVGWTVTANNYYFDYDNSFIGYACGFTSNGDLNIYLPVTGTPGWHYIDLYPGVYKGTEAGKIDQFRKPMLLLADHPGEVLPALHLAFYITG